jgi:HEAT repeat protein
MNTENTNSPTQPNDLQTMIRHVAEVNRTMQAERLRAIEILEHSSKLQTIEELIDALKDVHWSIQCDVVKLFTGDGSTESIEALIAVLSKWSSQARVAAACQLGELGDKRAVEPLINALRDEDDEVREAAAYSLGQLGDQQAVRPLVRLLNDLTWDVQYKAVLALARLGDRRSIDVLIQALKQEDNYAEREDSASILITMGIPVFDILMANLVEANPRAREYAAELLGDFGDERAIEPLIIALKDEDRIAMCALKQPGH